MQCLFNDLNLMFINYLCNVYFNLVAIWNSPEQRHEKKQLNKLLLIFHVYNDYQNNKNFLEKNNS